MAEMMSGNEKDKIDPFGLACCHIRDDSFQDIPHTDKLKLIGDVLEATNWTVEILIKNGSISYFRGAFNNIVKVEKILSTFSKDRPMNGLPETDRKTEESMIEKDEAQSSIAGVVPLRIAEESGRSHAARKDVSNIQKIYPLLDQDDVMKLSEAETSQNDSSQNLSIDERLWLYLLLHNADEYQTICMTHSCHMKPRSVINTDAIQLYLEISSSSSSKLSKHKQDEACEAFASLYQTMYSRLEIQQVPFPNELNLRDINSLLTEKKAMLVKTDVYHLVCPTENLDMAKGILGQALSKFHSGEAILGPVKNDIKGRQEWVMPNGLKVIIYQGNLIKQTTDVIVNPANVGLQHGSGAAEAIAKAAGHKLYEECKTRIARYGKLSTGEAIHTTAGNLTIEGKPSIKYVIHVAGPDAREIKDRNKCFYLLEKTFTNCLTYANEKLNVKELKAKSISIPAISSGIYKVPLVDVTLAAYTALWKFDKDNPTGRNLEEVHIVNIDAKTTERMQAEFRSKLDDNSKFESPISPDFRDEENGGIPRKRVRKLEPSSDVSDTDVQPSIESTAVGNVKSNGDKKLPNSQNRTKEPGRYEDFNEIAEKFMKNEPPPPVEEVCVICMDTMTNPKELSCKHKFCTECIEASFEQCQPKCPSCGQLFGVMKGNQPSGTMQSTLTSHQLVGYERCGCIETTYSFPDGIQEKNHPNSGHRYTGTQRKSYLPNNQEGQEVLALMKQAFDARLLFTVGRSMTTGHDNAVVWNDIHQKTSPHGQYGYPDPTYLTRVKAELAAKGIVPIVASRKK